MPEINPLSNDQIFLKKIAENTGSDYNTGDVSEINPLTIDQILLKEIAANTAGQSGDITELEEKVTANAEAIEATQDMISDAYDSTHTYNVGDYCIYENALYKCKTANTTGTWDSSKWDAVAVAEELGELTERVDRGSVSVTGDGVKTYTDLLNGLFALIDTNKISYKSRLRLGNAYVSVAQITNNYLVFDGIVDFLATGKMFAYCIYLSAANSFFMETETSASQTLFKDHSSEAVPSGQTISLYY